MYYLIDMERTKANGEIFFWKQSCYGYTRDITEAGIFTEKFSFEKMFNDLNKNTIRIEAEGAPEIIKELDNLLWK